MAAVTALGTATFNTTSGSKTVTATPAVSDLIIIVTAHTGNTAATAPTDNNSDGLGTYTQINTCVKATSVDTMKVWARNALVGSATSTVFTHNPGTTTGGGLVVLKVTGMLRTGSAAARASGVQSNQASGTPAVALGGAALTGNPLVGAVFSATNSTTTQTPPTSWTERFDNGYATPTTGLEVASIDSGFTGSTVTWGGASGSAFCSIAVELDTSAYETLTVELLQGSTVIATWTETPTTSFVTTAQTLTGTQADSITDYTQLQVRFTATGGAGTRSRVSWVEFEAPAYDPGGQPWAVPLSPPFLGYQIGGY